MLVEKLVGLAIIVIVLVVLVFQYIVPKLLGIPTFPSFRKKVLKDIPKESDVLAQLDETEQALKTTQYEKTLKARRQLLVEARKTISGEEPVQEPKQ
jgi:hypothetical protein